VLRHRNNANTIRSNFIAAHSNMDTKGGNERRIDSYLKPLIGHCFIVGWPGGGGGGSTLLHFPLAELPERRRKPFSPETIKHCT
jgi:hypothetical protein